jgi:hypothetical protein
MSAIPHLTHQDALMVIKPKKSGELKGIGDGFKIVLPSPLPMPRWAATLHFVIERGCDFIDLSCEVIEFKTKLSSRPERSAVEGPAVCPGSRTKVSVPECVGDK